MESDSPRFAVRRHVRAEREKRGWTQTDLADAAGVSRGTVANLERGMRLTEGKESKIEGVLGKPVGWLDDLRAGRVETPPPDDDSSQPPFDPETATAGDVGREFAYFAGKLSAEDFKRLLVFMDTYARLEQRPPTST